MLRGVVVDGVFVAAENVDGVAADAQAGTGDPPLVDRITNRGIGRPGAFGSHIALGGESGHQVFARGERRRIVRSGTDSCTVCRSSAPG